jgi:hypothetical protein
MLSGPGVDQQTMCRSGMPLTRPILGCSVGGSVAPDARQVLREPSGPTPGLAEPFTRPLHPHDRLPGRRVGLRGDVRRL